MRKFLILSLGIVTSAFGAEQAQHSYRPVNDYVPNERTTWTPTPLGGLGCTEHDYKWGDYLRETNATASPSCTRPTSMLATNPAAPPPETNSTGSPSRSDT